MSRTRDTRLQAHPGEHPVRRFRAWDGAATEPPGQDHRHQHDPVGEALRRRLSKGLVELDAHRDARVSELTPEEARDLLELRLSLDPLAASLAAERRTRADIAAMRETRVNARQCASMRCSATPPSTTWPPTGPSTMLSTRRSYNELLITTLGGLWDKSDRYRRLGLEVVRSQEERDQKDLEHQELFDAVARGDCDGAAAVMRQHISTSLGARAASRLRGERTAVLLADPPAETAEEP